VEAKGLRISLDVKAGGEMGDGVGVPGWWQADFILWYAICMRKIIVSWERKSQQSTEKKRC
jgi:hypothetical protein